MGDQEEPFEREELRPGCVLILLDGKGYLLLDDYAVVKGRLDDASPDEMMSFPSCRDLGPGRPDLDPCALTFERRFIVGLVEMTDRAWDAKVHLDESNERESRLGGLMIIR